MLEGEFKQALQDVLAEVSWNGQVVVEAAKGCITTDAYDIAHVSRRKLLDAAARLLQLATDPKEYLEQVAASVSSKVSRC